MSIASGETRIHTIPLNIGDFLADTLGMEAKERGAYISLLVAHIQAGSGGLPNDEKKLARMAGVTDKVWKNGLSEKMYEHFYAVETSEGMRIVNDRCLEIIQKVTEKSSQNSANALKGWEGGGANAKRQRRKRNAKQSQYPNTPLNPPNNQGGGSALRADAHASPHEGWKVALQERMKEEFYNSWGAHLRLEDGYVTADKAFHVDWCKNHYEREIMAALEESGLEFLGFRSPRNVALAKSG